ncbi:MAG: cation:proton antiporter [Candidatus Nanopelagicales bacterium]
MEVLPQILLLLGLAVIVSAAFQRLRIPTSLGYLLVGIVLGPYTVGPVVELSLIQKLAEFGVVFLLFTIGLSLSVPHMQAMRTRVLALGTAQVLLTIAVVGFLGWQLGLSPAVAFVFGAVFAQSSSAIIGRQLEEQGEDHTRHGRLGLAISVFQDITSIPLVVLIPVLAVAADLGQVSLAVGWSLVKAAAAIALVLLVGRRLLRPVLHAVSRHRSPELFTLTVLLVVLTAAWVTYSLGLSAAFGAFLAGLTLGETEFRHQVQSSIRPFRDVLLGLFFVTIGMIFDPTGLVDVWQWTLLGGAVLVLSKVIIVSVLVRLTRWDARTSLRTGLVVGVGGEFGLVLLAVAFNANVISVTQGDVALASVFLSLVLGALLIRFNGPIARVMTPTPQTPEEPSEPLADVHDAPPVSGHVIICGFGRIGQGVARFLDADEVPFIAVDLDPGLVRTAHAAGQQVYYGDAREPDVLGALGLATARLVLISYNDAASALQVLSHVRRDQPDLPVLVRVRDETHVDELREAGAIEVVPETLEAGLTIASQVLLLLGVPPRRVMRRVLAQRARRYPLLRQHEVAEPELLVEGTDPPLTRW